MCDLQKAKSPGDPTEAVAPTRNPQSTWDGSLALHRHVAKKVPLQSQAQSASD